MYGVVNYTLVAGDTLYSIARRYNTTVRMILMFNPGIDPNALRVGQVLVIPLSPANSKIYTVRAGDTLYSIAKMHGTTADMLARVNFIAPPYTIYPGWQLIVPA
jgi:LysM repeat protein